MGTALDDFEQCVFAAKSRRDDVRSRCTSGGMYWELAVRTILDEGVVYGCAFDESLRAHHVRCSTLAEVERCMGSKYSQSDVGDTFSQVLADLKRGRSVLFTGTPCQVAGLVGIVPAGLRDSILLVDLVCHGAPSPTLFQQHLGAMERARDKRIVGYEHRPKNVPWGEHLEMARYDDGSQEQGTRLSGVWRQLFYSNTALRPACYACPWSIDRRKSDITIADYWGIDQCLPGYRDAKGVSLVIVNSLRGHRAFEELDVEAVPTSLESACAGNPNLRRPTARPEQRDEVWESFWSKGFRATCQAYGFRISLVKQLYRKLKLLLSVAGLRR